MPDASSEPIGPSPRPRGASRLAQLIARLRAFGRRHRAVIAVVGSLATAAILAFLLAGRADEFEAALSAASASVLAATVLLQVIGLLARSEAWHLTIEAAGGTVERRVLYRASSMQVVGSVIALAALAQLPVGPSVGAAAAVLILGSDGVAAAAAAGVLMTVTGTIGGLCFAAWAGADRLWSLISRARLRRAHARAPRSH